jgi:hypothetical protein
MAKRSTAFELVLPLRDAGRLAHRWLYDALRTEILEGRLRPGGRLPATRETFVSSHQLVAAISAADIAAAGQVLVLVFNPPERGTTSVSDAIGNTSSTPCGGGNSSAVQFTIN